MNATEKRLGILLIAGAMAWSAPVASRAEPPALRDQLAVMLQLDNMLESCPDNRFGARAVEVERQFKLLEEAGVRWCRTGIGWEQIEPKPGEWNWAPADTIVHAAKQHHVQLLWLVGNTAPWDSSNKEWNGVPRDLHKPGGHFPNFVHRLAERYKGDVHYWEIRNEPNLDYMWHGTSAHDYAVYLAEASRAIRNADGGAHIVFGGLGGGVGAQVHWFREAVAELRKREAALPFDIANFHVYAGEADDHGFKGKGAVPRYLDSAGQQIEKVMHETGLDSMPFWITEFDYPANAKLQPDPDYGGGAAGQARLVREMFGRLVENHPHRKIFWASLLDDYNDKGFESTGLVKSNKHHDIETLRPAYEALKQLLTGN